MGDEGYGIAPDSSTFLNRVTRWIRRAQDRSDAPWYLDGTAVHDFPVPVLLYGAFRRSGSMLRISFVVLRNWWKSPFEPQIVSNGSQLTTSVAGNAVKPVIWLASVVVAGVAGSDFSSRTSGVTSATRLAEFIYLGIVFLVVVASYQWYVFLKRLARVLNNWVGACGQLQSAERRDLDVSLFGYTIGDRFRSRIRVTGVGPFSVFSFFGILFLMAAIGSIH
jgi:hypothetical protein